MEILKIISQITLLIFLAGAALQDLRRETINVLYIICGALAGAVLNIVCNIGNWKNMAEGAAVGLVILIIGFAGRQAIGYGDGLMLTATGLYLGLTGNIMLLLISLFLTALCAIFLLLLRYKRKNDRIPFIPFMLGGYILMKAIGI